LSQTKNQTRRVGKVNQARQQRHRMFSSTSLARSKHRRINTPYRSVRNLVFISKPMASLIIPGFRM
jgi:hypothetical protein